MASSRNEFFHWARRDISTADETDAYTTRGVEFNGYAVRLGICVSLQQNGYAKHEAPIHSYGFDASPIHVFIGVPRFASAVFQ
jgi:hypothetical protein